MPTSSGSPSLSNDTGAAAGEDLAGILCACGGNTWRTVGTGRGWGCVRRRRACANCGRRVSTVERVEASGHPERELAGG
jgi:hypothetical protein